MAFLTAKQADVIQHLTDGEGRSPTVLLEITDEPYGLAIASWPMCAGADTYIKMRYIKPNGLMITFERPALYSTPVPGDHTR